METNQYFQWLAKYYTNKGWKQSREDELHLENEMGKTSTVLRLLGEGTKKVTDRYNTFDSYALVELKAATRHMLHLNLQKNELWICVRVHLTVIPENELWITLGTERIDHEGKELDERQPNLTEEEKNEVSLLFRELEAFVQEMPEYRLYFATNNVRTIEDEIEVFLG